MDESRRFTGKQVTVIVVALAIAAIGAPAGVLAATGTSIRLVDGSNPHHAAAVSKNGAVSVAVKGTTAVSPGPPKGAFTLGTTTANSMLDKAKCGTKFAITSFAATGNVSATALGLDAVGIGSGGNSSTGDLIQLRVPANDTRELTFPQPFILDGGNGQGTCKNTQLFLDGGDNASVMVTGYRFR